MKQNEIFVEDPYRKAVCLATAGLSVAVQASGGIVEHARVSADGSFEIEIETSELFNGLTEHVFGRGEPDEVLKQCLEACEPAFARRIAIAHWQVAGAVRMTFFMANIASDTADREYVDFLNRVSDWLASLRNAVVKYLQLSRVDACQFDEYVKRDYQELVGRNWQFVWWTYHMLLSGDRTAESYLIGKNSGIEKAALVGWEMAQAYFEGAASGARQSAEKLRNVKSEKCGQRKFLRVEIMADKQ